MGQEATQERLVGILYRFDCPSPLTIGEYVLDLLEEPARIELALHALECGLCDAELRASRTFLATDLREECLAADHERQMLSMNDERWQTVCRSVNLEA